MVCGTLNNSSRTQEKERNAALRPGSRFCRLQALPAAPAAGSQHGAFMLSGR